jgi:hypothetical protein
MKGFVGWTSLASISRGNIKMLMMVTR